MTASPIAPGRRGPRSAGRNPRRRDRPGRGGGAPADRALRLAPAPRGVRDRRGHRGRAVLRVRRAPLRLRRPRIPETDGAVDRRPASRSARSSAGSASSAGCGSSSRASRAGSATRRTPRRSSCGSTAGSGCRSSPRSSARPGAGSTRSRRSSTSLAAIGRRLGLHGPATLPYPAAPAVLAGRRRVRHFVWLELVIEGARAGRLLVGAPRPVHAVDPGDDGPVRPRHVAGPRGDVLGLVRDPRPARAPRARASHR